MQWGQLIEGYVHLQYEGHVWKYETLKCLFFSNNNLATLRISDQLKTLDLGTDVSTHTILGLQNLYSFCYKTVQSTLLHDTAETKPIIIRASTNLGLALGCTCFKGVVEFKPRSLFVQELCLKLCTCWHQELVICSLSLLSVFVSSLTLILPPKIILILTFIYHTGNGGKFGRNLLKLRLITDKTPLSVFKNKGKAL